MAVRSTDTINEELDSLRIDMGVLQEEYEARERVERDLINERAREEFRITTGMEAANIDSDDYSVYRQRARDHFDQSGWPE